MCKIMEEILDEGLEKGREEGREEGRVEQAQLMAFKMAIRGNSPEEIADLVGYDTQTVKMWLGDQSSLSSASTPTRV